MQVLAQGLISASDYFIHPAYVSSSGYEDIGMYVTIWTIIGILLISATYYLLTRPKEHKERYAWNYHEFEKGPPKE